MASPRRDCCWGKECKSKDNTRKPCPYNHPLDKSGVPMVKSPLSTASNAAGKSPYKTPPKCNIKRDRGTSDPSLSAFARFLDNATLRYKKKSPCRDGLDCVNTDTEHLQRFRHRKYNPVEIEKFKPAADEFLEVSYPYFNTETKSSFADEWLCDMYRIKQDANDIFDPKTNRVNAAYDEYESYYFLLIANIFLHLEEYYEQYGYDYLYIMLFLFDQLSVTGSYTVPPDSEVGIKLQAFKETYPKLDFDETKLDNSTIFACLKQLAGISGGKSNKTHKRVKRKTNKTNKRVKSVKSIKSIKRKSNKTHKTHKRNKTHKRK
jgi:hypothetical protein